MIRTSLTLSISPQDSQKISFLVNGTHLGLLSQSAQNIHVQTSHRALQLIVAIRAAEPASGPALTRQRQQINAWQSFAQLLAKKGPADLNNMISQYHLQPEWLILLDEQRLQAWMPADTGFYLLRQDILRRLRPVTLREMAQTDEAHPQGSQYYSLSIALADQYFILPTSLLGFFSTGEAAAILTGLRQQPARMGDLLNTARARGFAAESTWMAMQITHYEPDIVPGEPYRSAEKPWAWRDLLSVFKPGGFTQEKNDEPADSLTLAENEEPMIEVPKQPIILQILSSRRFWMTVAAGLAIIAVLILAFAVGRMLSKKPVETTITTESAETTETAEPTKKPTPTTKPTTTQTTTEALPELTVTARVLNLREGPDRKSRLLATLKTGDILIRLAEPDGDWVKVRTEEGLIGYVFYNYVDEVSP